MGDKDLEKRAFSFALRIIKLAKFLKNERQEFVLAKQVLRSGISIGANVVEGFAGISNADFSAKISIAYKEAHETDYWLKLLFESGYIEKEAFDSIQKDCQELCKILFVILKNQNRTKPKD